MATISEVAARAGVSAATVSRVLNGNPQVSERTRALVIEAARELGYRPNFLARSLARRHGLGVGMVVGDISAPHYGGLIRAAEQELRAAGQMLVVASGYMRKEGEREAIRFLRDQRCAALMIHAGGLDEQELSDLARGDVPVVVINRHIPRIEAACLWVDHRAAGRAAARELVAAGHRRIATITGPLRIADATDRHAGFLEELARHGVDVAEANTYQGDYRLASGAEGVRVLLARGQRFTALFCGNDSMAGDRGHTGAGPPRRRGARRRLRDRLRQQRRGRPGEPGSHDHRHSGGRHRPQCRAHGARHPGTAGRHLLPRVHAEPGAPRDGRPAARPHRGRPRHEVAH